MSHLTSTHSNSPVHTNGPINKTASTQRNHPPHHRESQTKTIAQAKKICSRSKLPSKTTSHLLPRARASRGPGIQEWQRPANQSARRVQARASVPFSTAAAKRNVGLDARKQLYMTPRCPSSPVSAFPFTAADKNRPATSPEPVSSRYSYSCPKPIVSSTAIVIFCCSISRFLYGGKSSRLKLVQGQHLRWTAKLGGDELRESGNRVWGTAKATE